MQVGGIGTAIGIHIVPEFVEFQKFKVVVIVWLIGAAVCDAAITLSLTWYLVSIPVTTGSVAVHLLNGHPCLRDDTRLGSRTRMVS